METKEKTPKGVKTPAQLEKMMEKLPFKEKIRVLAEHFYGPFYQINGEADWRDGWKIYIQGKTIDDVVYLVENLLNLMVATKASFKFGTKMLIDMKNEQSSKLLTIYIPNGVDAKSYAELVRINIPDYKGAEGIPDKRSYIKHSEGIFYRNDRSDDGTYIPA